MNWAGIAARVLVLFVSACLSTAGGAAGQRSFVSSTGVDNPTCSLAAPCRGFAAAVMATNPSGEVVALDSAGYGAVTITKAISIIAAPGAYAAITAAGGDGVVVNAGSGDKIVLRGLVINAMSSTNGIWIHSASEVYVEDCTVDGAGQWGIFIDANASVVISRTVVRNSLYDGIEAITNTPIPPLSITLADSTLTNNGGCGFSALSAAVGTVNSVVARVVATGNNCGLRAAGGGPNTASR